MQGPGCKKHPSPHAYRDRTDGKVYAALVQRPDSCHILAVLSSVSTSPSREGLWKRYAVPDARDAVRPSMCAKAAGAGRCTALGNAAQRVVNGACDTRDAGTGTVRRAGGCTVIVRTVTGNDLRPAAK